MDNLPLLPLIMRWLHILSACIALGGPFFVRFALLPAANSLLDDETHQKLRERVNRVWGRIVYLVIALFLMTGIYNYLRLVHGWDGGTPWPRGAARVQYEALFGLKVLLALGVFFLASALAGRSEAFAGIRKNAKMWLTVLIMSLLVVMMLATSMRALREGATLVPAGAASGTMPATGHSL